MQPALVRWTLLACVVTLACQKSKRGTPDPAAPPSASGLSVAASAPVPPVAASAAPSAAPSPPPRSPCPQEMALVQGRVCVDRWEASLLDEDGNPHSPYHSVGAKKVRAVSRSGAVPQAYIAADEARAACKRADKHLCTTEEWLLACEGTAPQKRTYPYGAKSKKGVCNTARREHPVTRVFGKHVTDSVSLNNPRLNQLDDTVSKTGEFSECVSPEGVHDLVGNLLEWTRSTYVRPLAMGGFYLDETTNGKGCAYVTSAHGSEYHDFATGFRCCKKPDRTVIAAQAAAPGDAASANSAWQPTPEDRDPPTMRGFLRAAGTLPKVKPPAYDPKDAACPVDMVLASGLRCAVPEQRCKRWLPRRSAGQKIACAEFAEPVECSGPKRKMRYCIDRYEFQPDGYHLPLTHVNWTEAQNLCSKMDKRLCFEDEWEFACEGEAAMPYPYGFLRDGKKCNHDFPEEELVTAPDVFIDRRVAQDALPQCKSPFGVYNLVGNVDEWTTRYNRERPKRSILRGGWWLIGRNRCRAATDNHSEIYAGMQTGFRCCKGARP